MLDRNGSKRPIRVRRHESSDTCNELVGRWKVHEGVKITSVAYVAFLKEHLERWFKSKPLSLKRKTIFMHGNAPSHAANTTGDYLQKICFKNSRVMVWPLFSPDWNPIENMWSIHKRKVYASGRQFPTKTESWSAISTTTNNIFLEEIRKLTDSMNKRLISVISNHADTFICNNNTSKIMYQILFIWMKNCYTLLLS